MKATQMIEIDRIKPYEKNAKKHPESQIKKLAEIIKEFGFRVPITVDSDMVIVAGHGRYESAKLLGMKEVPVNIADDLTPQQIRAYRIADNKIAETDWDLELLETEIRELDSELLDYLGFEEAELEEILREKENNWGDKDPDEIPEVPQNVRGVERGQIWKLGDHRMMCGDSTSKDDVERLMGGEKADMVFTDPPYGIQYDDETKTKWTRQDLNSKMNNFGQIKNDHVPVQVFFEKILEFFGYANRIFIWGVLNGNGNVPPGSFIVWDKKNEAQAKCPFGDFDICWSKNVGWKMLRHIWGGFVSKEKGEPRWHPTQKPVSLVVDFFERWGKSSDNVVDLFLGSGSTLIACEKTNRKCFGMEIDPHYCSVIIERWEKFTEKKAELVEPSPHVFPDGSLQYESGV